ncbi:unnamed protein product [Leptidea sinapis]|uniref:Corticotropin-releasing factor-binding protein n=1 Tax=Leptidea sinapis TaxID=189913 RepID=A0A5E4QUN4_9NEOP|nr:unnamed protein product [Leptidea sinapis]
MGVLFLLALVLTWIRIRFKRCFTVLVLVLKNCFMVTSEEGELFFKSPSNEPVVCGIYMIAEPDKRIQVTFNYLDVPCDNGGLVAWIDGWELSGQVWPADSWDDERVVESCDRRPQHKLVSRQNAALVQYRVPAKGKGFAVTIRHLKNSKRNCSVIAISPSVVRVLDLNVGQTCTKRGLADYVDIGGASGLDHTRMEVFDSMCGLDSNEDTVVRLVSSGKFQNSVTLAFAPLSVENIEDADLICGFNEV